MNDSHKKYKAVPIPKPSQNSRLRADFNLTQDSEPPDSAPPQSSEPQNPDSAWDSEPQTPDLAQNSDLNQNSDLQSLRQSSMSSETFYEIEYDSGPFPGVGRYVLKSQKIAPPERDEIRELFQQMRDIAREERYLNYNSSRFYDKKVRQENARIFYRQGLFMKDFEDNYEKTAPFSSYFPDYQMMGYEQLRTYFTWRTKVRRGEITETSLSYVFLYLYELLNNIGVDGPEDGLKKLMSFWSVSRTYDQAVDKYVLKWLKDYHIYYELPWSFKEFITENGLRAHYPNILNPDDNFDLLCSISKYDIRKSGFYNDDTVGLIRDCFEYVLHRLRETFSENGIILDNFLFQPPKNMTPWTPFRDALFYTDVKKPDRQVVLSQKELYVCRQNRWLYHSTITTEGGKQLIGYVLKQMESDLRKAVKYKYKLSANINVLGPATAAVLRQADISLEKLVTDAVWEFYRETTKTVVKVDPNALERIRREALLTQEKLIVPEEESALFGSTNLTASFTDNITAPFTDNTEPTAASADNTKHTTASTGHMEHIAASADNTKTAVPSAIQQETIPYIQTTPDGQLVLNPEMLSAQAPEECVSKGSSAFAAKLTSDASVVMTESTSAAGLAAVPADAAQDDPWRNLWDAMSDLEKQALFILWREQTDNSSDIKQFARKHNIMLEVLIDGINEKAMDHIGDSLLDGEFTIYEDYTEQIEGMVKHLWQDKYPQESPIS